MSGMSIVIQITREADGFLRRECPACGRQFSCWPEAHELQWTDEPGTLPGLTYYCPYCSLPAGSEQWYTPRQVALVEAQAFDLLVGPGLQQLQTALHTMVPSPSEPASEKPPVSPSPEPEPIKDPLPALIHITFPCHQEKPIKIKGNWRQDVTCLCCGTLYPMQLVSTP
jgi:hypothetical protein